ncbi:GGDEF domain-containing protein [Cellvibrio zantedeschiae]|uniref:GGDEF domain-containing protein n=1 Tax=Cellvibrio zantedeschiae TaxID=1237077 RepID=A0ABQ3AWJ1_9GAMM|nr:EAL domain-containing protein [Cellvibrio zantedeschiae]GGY66430.1 GGDEF domain-containing protein [Cellvibrio zantedeschiae]
MNRLNAKPTVLVVDDDEAARLMMAATLEQADFSVVTAADCAEARQVFEQNHVDIILLDVLLPDGDGFTLCAEFLKHPRGRDLPIAMVTGLDDVESIALGYQSGATDFITKPVSWGTLPYRIQYILRASNAFLDLSLSESKTRALLSAIPDIIMRVQRDGKVLDMQVGSYVYDMGEWLTHETGDLFGYLPKGIFNSVEAVIDSAFANNEMQLIEFQWSQDPSRIRYWEARVLPRGSNEVLMVVREITNRKKQDNQLRLWAKVFEGSNEAIMITDADLHIISVNRAYENIMGFTEAEVLGVDTIAEGARLHTHSFFRNLVSILREQGYWQGELFNQRKNGETFPSWYSISLVSNAQGKPENYIAIFNDITEFKNSRAQIEFLAHHDNLTGLPNRVLLNDRLDMAINTAKRLDEKVGVLFIDLDRFKNVNDSLGHTVGDQLLKEAAKRLSSTIRTGDTVSRLGGDEFVVLFPKIKDETSLADLTIKLRDVLQHPYNLGDISLHITPSIGIAVYPDDGENVNSLIKNADAAMYLAKEKGRNNYQFYTPLLNARTLDRLKLESDLRLALEHGGFEVHYQPQLISKTGSLWGAEALVRWRHPERGLISPVDFIPLAEETGLIIPLGDWVFAQAARQVTAWRKQGMPNLVVAVNISVVQFRKDDFIQRIEAILKEEGAVSSSIELELTESILMHDMESSIQTLNYLRGQGFRIAIDDFGTGYSSLNYLRRLPVNVLKIDQSFVREMLVEQASLAIVESIISLAHSLGKETIAEGVETKAELDVLTDRGCRLMQGYYFSKPLPAPQFEAWVKARENHSLAMQRY